MLNKSFGNAIASRASDDRPSGARPIGQLSGTKRFRDSVGIRDKVDFYSFTLRGRSSFNLSLSNLKSNVDVFLQRGKRVIDRSTKGGNQSESIATTLEAGTYFVRVNQKSGNSKYRLTLNAISSDNGGTPPPPGATKYLVQVTSDGSRVLKLNTATGATSVLAVDRSTSRFDDYMEVASSGSELFVTKGLASGGILGSFGRGLYKIDQNTGAESFVGDFGVKIINSNDNQALDAMGFAASGDLYGVFNFAVREGESSISAKFFPALYSINKNTGQATFISKLNEETRIGQGIDDIVFNPASGRFLASFYRGDGRFGQLLSIGLTGDVQNLGFLPETRLTGMFFQDGVLNGFNGNRRVTIDITRKKTIGDGPLQIEVFESAELPLTEPNSEQGAVLGAG